MEDHLKEEENNHQMPEIIFSSTNHINPFINQGVFNTSSKFALLNPIGNTIDNSLSLKAQIKKLKKEIKTKDINIKNSIDMRYFQYFIL